MPRQTLLFSATFADEVKGVAGQFLRRDYQVSLLVCRHFICMPLYVCYVLQLIDTVGDDEEQTHSHVPQHIMSGESYHSK